MKWSCVPRLALPLLALAGCGGSSPHQTSEPGQTSTETPSAAQSPTTQIAATSSPKVGGDGQLKVGGSTFGLETYKCNRDAAGNVMYARARVLHGQPPFGDFAVSVDAHGELTGSTYVPAPL